MVAEVFTPAHKGKGDNMISEEINIAGARTVKTVITKCRNVWASTVCPVHMTTISHLLHLFALQGRIARWKPFLSKKSIHTYQYFAKTKTNHCKCIWEHVFCSRWIKLNFLSIVWKGMSGGSMVMAASDSGTVFLQLELRSYFGSRELLYEQLPKLIPNSSQWSHEAFRLLLKSKVMPGKAD